MSKTYYFFSLFLIVCFSGGVCLAQKKDRVEISAKVFADAGGKNCENPKPGRPATPSNLNYPAEAKTARVGGTVTVAVDIDEKGTVTTTGNVSGHRLLQPAAIDAARRIKFIPTVCGSAPTASSALLIFNFLPSIVANSYFMPAKIEEFTDLKNDSPYYEAVLSLTENYRLAFGYADKKFYADAPLTYGDLAHSLRLTLDLLSARAVAANKLPGEINLFYPLNPQKITSIGGVKNLKPGESFYESVKTLLLKYDIALVNERAEFQSSRYPTNNEVIDLWSKIFGAEAIPVNFGKIDDSDPIISRGEFALFLTESLQVLTYKVLP